MSQDHDQLGLESDLNADSNLVLDQVEVLAGWSSMFIIDGCLDSTE